MLRNLYLITMPVAIATWHVEECYAQAEQYALDTISNGISGVIWTDATSTTDGGTVLHLTTTDGGPLWKMDQSGAPAWCKQYGISSEHRARMPDGGVVFCEITGFLTQGDTTFNHLQVVKIDAEGSVVWSKLLRIHDPYNSLFDNLWLCIASDDDGNFLITMSELQGNAYQWFYCLDADGELLWSRNFLFNVNADHGRHICRDGFGGWYFGSYEWGMSVFRLGHLNFLGEMTWYNSYAVPSPQEFWLGSLCSLGFAPIAVGGYEVVFDEDYRWFVMRLNLNGTMDWFRVSTTPQAALAHCSGSSTGELLVSDGVEGLAYTLTRLTAAGEVVSSSRSSMHTVDGSTYSSWFIDWDLIETTLTMGNMLVTYSDTSAFPIYRPAVWRLPIADLSACGAEPMELSSVMVSNNAVAVQDQPYSEVEVPVTITDTVCTVTSFTPLSVSDYCYYFTGIPPVVQATSLGKVLTTLLVPGEPIMVVAPAARCGLSVHDARGSLLYRASIAPNGMERIPTTSWNTGLYFVRFQPVDGGRPNVVKVMIE